MTLNGLPRFYCRGRVVALLSRMGSGLRLVVDIETGMQHVVHENDLQLRPRGLPDPKRNVTKVG